MLLDMDLNRLLFLRLLDLLRHRLLDHHLLLLAVQSDRGQGLHHSGSRRRNRAARVVHARRPHQSYGGQAPRLGGVVVGRRRARRTRRKNSDLLLLLLLLRQLRCGNRDELPAGILQENDALLLLLSWLALAVRL